MITYTQQDYLNTLTDAGLVTDSNLYGHAADSVQGLTYNSKEAASGTLFVCKGAAFRPEYLADAVSHGATLYVSEQKFDLNTEVPYILVSDVRKAMPYLGKLFYNDPSKDLNLIGVGGTKGKSTTAYYVKAIVDDYMASLGKKESAVISSIDVYDGITKVESHITTPENIELMQHFRNAVDSGIDFLEMEVSSQALKYGRVEQIMFDAAIFLNISDDHISPIEHPDFEDYFSSKLKMFAQTKNALINTNSDYFERVAEAAKAAPNVITFGTNEGSDIYGYDIEKVLPVEVDRLQPDYSIYNIDSNLSYGFLTRGCPNRCKWRVVHKKEGKISPYMDIEEITAGRKKAILMDNNILASNYGLQQIEKIIKLGIKVDFNQGLDARLITDEIARLLAKVKWIKRIRFGCDTPGQIAEVESASALIEKYGYKGEYFLYCILIDFEESFARVNYWKSKSRRFLPHCHHLVEIAHFKNFPALIR